MADTVYHLLLLAVAVIQTTALPDEPPAIANKNSLERGEIESIRFLFISPHCLSLILTCTGECFDRERLPVDLNQTWPGGYCYDFDGKTHGLPLL